MRRPKQNRDIIKSNRFTIAISDSEKNRLEAIADENGVSMSALARQILRDFFKKEEV